MKTLTNVLRHGRTYWDRDLLPDDEYVVRTRVVRDRMEREGLDVLVGLGHSTMAGDFAYLSGHVPPLNWMGTVLGRDQGPLLITGGGSRDVPFLSTQSWLTDIRTSRSLFAGPAAVIVDAVAEMAPVGAKVGVAGVEEALDAQAIAELEEALAGYEVIDAGPLMDEIRAVKRPRELVALRESDAIARRAVTAGLEAHAHGATAARALLAAEHSARLDGARDVRVLGGPGDRDLAPAVPASSTRGDDLVLYCVAETRGYWGQACGCTADPHDALVALEAMLAAVRAGVTAGSVAEAALALLAPDAAEVALSYGLGASIGLDEAEVPVIAPGSEQVLHAGVLLALQVVTRSVGPLVCAGATLLVGESAASRW